MSSAAKRANISAQLSKKSAGLLVTFAKYGGFGGLVLFVFWTLFSMFGDLKPFFSKLSPEHTYSVIIVFMLLVFVFSVVALVCWVYVQSLEKKRKQVRAGMLILTVLILSGIGAWANTGQIKNNIWKSKDSVTVPSVTPPKTPVTPIPPKISLQDSEWKINLQPKELAPYSGTIQFHKEQQAEAKGYFVFNSKAKKPTKCSARVAGTWSDSDTSVTVSAEHLFWATTYDDLISESGEPTKPQPVPVDFCDAMLAKTKLPVSATCKVVTDINNCVGDELVLHRIIK